MPGVPAYLTLLLVLPQQASGRAATVSGDELPPGRPMHEQMSLSLGKQVTLRVSGILKRPAALVTSPQKVARASVRLHRHGGLGYDLTVPHGTNPFLSCLKRPSVKRPLPFSDQGGAQPGPDSAGGSSSAPSAASCGSSEHHSALSRSLPANSNRSTCRPTQSIA
jgi:hypothetical protein